MLIYTPILGISREKLYTWCGFTKFPYVHAMDYDAISGQYSYSYINIPVLFVTQTLWFSPRYFCLTLEMNTDMTQAEHHMKKFFDIGRIQCINTLLKPIHEARSTCNTAMLCLHVSVCFLIVEILIRWAMLCVFVYGLCSKRFFGLRRLRQDLDKADA